MTKLYTDVLIGEKVQTPFIAVPLADINDYVKANAKLEIKRNIIFAESTSNYIKIEYMPTKLLQNETDLKRFSEVYSCLVSSFLNNIDYNKPILLPFEYMYISKNEVLTAEKGEIIDIEVENQDFYVLFPRYFPTPQIQVMLNGTVQASKNVQMLDIKYAAHKYSNIKGNITINWI